MAARCSFCWLLVALLLLPSAPALATWSIVAVDTASGEVGSAGASCTNSVGGIVGIVPGKGVIVAQAASNPVARRKGVELLRQGHSPKEIVATISDIWFDGSAARQQYGVVSLAHAGQPAGFTGGETAEAHADLQAYGVSVQGNIMADANFAKIMLAAYRKAHRNPAFSLADRLLAALEAGAKAGGGDRRCGRRQTALSAYLVVAQPGDFAEAPSLHIVIPGQLLGENNAVELLRFRYGK
ncbi:MAG: DUF1028 domain-containing protein [Alphaproteobacteria bacterium]|jgi:uncharacterized Ntn-hydrolase superfamily protein|nr:hypothetical protein [Rhodospirillaceae bacterium]MDP6406075.1 DUF1028 domain-containing protein [Alphaproteobacteria bacterium]MDP6622354.1 DUF1028 domain-containing protein [Alphaproteobacteria bacterium]